MKFLKFICLLFLVSLLSQSCSDSVSFTVCTAEFVTHSLTVTGPNGSPADSVDIKVINKKNEEVYPCDEYLCEEHSTGTYIIMHDGLREKLSKLGDKIIVEGQKDELRFREEFIFGKGECHVQKVAGPDTVSLSSN